MKSKENQILELEKYDSNSKAEVELVLGLGALFQILNDTNLKTTVGIVYNYFPIFDKENITKIDKRALASKIVRTYPIKLIENAINAIGLNLRRTDYNIKPSIRYNSKLNNISRYEFAKIHFDTYNSNTTNSKLKIYTIEELKKLIKPAVSRKINKEKDEILPEKELMKYTKLISIPNKNELTEKQLKKFKIIAKNCSNDLVIDFLVEILSNQKHSKQRDSIINKIILLGYDFELIKKYFMESKALKVRMNRAIKEKYQMDIEKVTA